MAKWIPALVVLALVFTVGLAGCASEEAAAPIEGEVKTAPGEAAEAKGGAQKPSFD